MTANQPYPEPPPQPAPAPAPVYQPPPYQPPMYQPNPPGRTRPTGVTILAILLVLGGIFELIAAFGIFVIAALVNVTEVRNNVGNNVPDWILNNFALFFGALGLFFLIMAIISLILAWAFLKGKNWARVVAIILLVISIIGNILGVLGGQSLVSVAISILIPLIIVWYLYRPYVKQWFTA